MIAFVNTWRKYYKFFSFSAANNFPFSKFFVIIIPRTLYFRSVLFFFYTFRSHFPPHFLINLFQLPPTKHQTKQTHRSLSSSTAHFNYSKIEKKKLSNHKLKSTHSHYYLVGRSYSQYASNCETEVNFEFIRVWEWISGWICDKLKDISTIVAGKILF